MFHIYMRWSSGIHGTFAAKFSTWEDAKAFIPKLRAIFPAEVVKLSIYKGEEVRP